MKQPEYIKPGGKGAGYIDFLSLPESKFLDGLETKEIYNIRMLSRTDKADISNYIPGSNDVELKSLDGRTQRISRKDLAKNYTYASGNKIKVMYMKSNTEYTVYKAVYNPVKVFKLPDNCKGVLPNNTISSNGDFIVARVTDDGQIDRQNIFALNSSKFKKAYRIPMQSIIAIVDNRGNGNKVSRKIFSLTAGRKPNRQISQDMAVAREFSDNRKIIKPNNNRIVTDTNIDVPDNNRVSANNNRIVTETTITNSRINTQVQLPKYRYTVTNRLVDINNNLVGYAILDKKTNRTSNINENQLKKLCSSHVVDNVALVQNSNGYYYLRGNGIVLNTLPSVII